MAPRVKAMSWMFSGAGVALGVPALAGMLYGGWYSLSYTLFPPYRIGGPWLDVTRTRSGYLTPMGLELMKDLFVFSSIAVVLALALFFAGAWLRLGLRLGRIAASVLLAGLFSVAAYGWAVSGIAFETYVCACTAGVAVLGLWQLRAA